MEANKLSRRKFIRDTSLAAGGMVVGALAAKGNAINIKTEAAIRKTPSFNPDMEYRRLGKTNLWVSAVCLGGHWKRINVMKQDFNKNRRDVVSRCIDVGINYIDACCRSEVLAYIKALVQVGGPALIRPEHLLPPAHSPGSDTSHPRAA